ncbi:MAG: c-type cytochrome [Sandaracinaceae bacterium]|nr:c-type cytochrome [Sandaracinaceae bacterium]MDW8246122.1 cbb3-type cytochrome c oxidase N-terminal domain-containing protein [Sandaracinaceae bacterium]
MADVKQKDPIQGDILHEYDGILEADNLLPRWWLATFYGTIVFSGFYWFYYEAFDIGKSPAEQYAAWLEEESKKNIAVTDEMLIALPSDSTRVEKGRAVFSANCAACHGREGEGNIGPNLTDNAWLHGGRARDIYRTISEGVVTAGMPPWGQTLGQQGVLDVTAFVLSIRNTNKPGKPPQGQIVDDQDNPITPSGSSTEGEQHSSGADKTNDKTDSNHG